MIVNEIFRAITYLFIAAIVCGVYTLGNKPETITGTKLSAILKGLLGCAVIAFIAMSFLGQPSCDERDDTGCVSYADDGFDPTNEQRMANFAYFFTLLSVPYTLGVAKRKEKERSL